MGVAKSSLLQSALREMQLIFTQRIRLIAMGLAIALLAIAGPFGTMEYDVPVRLLYWGVVVVATYTLGQIAGVLTVQTIAARIPSPIAQTPIIALASSLPASCVVFIATALAEPSITPNFALLWFYVFAVSCALVAVMKALPQTSPAASEISAASAPVLDRLPLHMRGKLMHLEVSDHYVEVTTDKGTTLVLIRLSDAIKETAPVAGLQVHRSHWVALDAVRKAVRENGKLFLELESGKRVPVSRSYMDAVKAAKLVQ